MSADSKLIRRNGWRRMAPPRRGYRMFHSERDWWWHPDCNWHPKEEAVVLSCAWEREEAEGRAATLARLRFTVGELRCELDEAQRELHAAELEGKANG